MSLSDRRIFFLRLRWELAVDGRDERPLKRDEDRIDAALQDAIDAVHHSVYRYCLE